MDYLTGCDNGGLVEFFLVRDGERKLAIYSFIVLHENLLRVLRYLEFEISS